MIFVTVGTQLPFNRMVRAVDEWAGCRGRGTDVFAQIGPDDPGGYLPRHMQWTRFLRADACTDLVLRSRVVVAHAGMGSILTALQLARPILVMPRRGDLGEHRNDHQVATAKRLLAQGCVNVAFDETELWGQLDELEVLRPVPAISAEASPALVAALRHFASAAPAASFDAFRLFSPLEASASSAPASPGEEHHSTLPPSTGMPLPRLYCH
jgi:UDP-N-acetylglucosamine transferase subunit ALG13